MIEHCNYRYIHNFSCCEIHLKKIQTWTGLKPWPLQYQFSALPTELSSQLGVGHIVSYVISADGENTSEHVWTVEKDMKKWLIITVTHIQCIHNQRSCEITAWINHNHSDHKRFIYLTCKLWLLPSDTLRGDIFWCGPELLSSSCALNPFCVWLSWFWFWYLRLYFVRAHMSWAQAQSR